MYPSEHILVEDRREKECLSASALLDVLPPRCSCWSCPTGKLSATLSLHLFYTISHHTAPADSRGSCSTARSFPFRQGIPYQSKVQPSCSGGRSLKDPKRRNEHFLLFFCLSSKQQTIQRKQLSFLQVLAFLALTVEPTPRAILSATR